MSTVSCCTSDVGSRVPFTFDIVNWDILSSIACQIHQVDSAHWENKTYGGYNLVRFLHLHDSTNTTVVVRVPLRSDDMNANHELVLSKRIESEVATMEYVEKHTNIPVPHVYYYSTTFGEDVRSPYILMSKVEGVPLFLVWNDMDDAKRRIVLRQVTDILLELWSHRFDKAGVLFKRPDGRQGKDNWSVESRSVLEDPNEVGPGDLISTTAYSHAADYWLANTNASLHDSINAQFGSDMKIWTYSEVWFLRSLVPSLFDPSLDAHLFPLCPGDCHSQNIMIVDADTDPRISAVIDWKFSGPTYSTSFAQ